MKTQKINKDSYREMAKKFGDIIDDLAGNGQNSGLSK